MHRHTLLAALVGGFSAVTAAQEMPPIVITGARFASGLDDAPANVTVVGSEAIAASGATSLAEVLDYQAGLQVQELFAVGGSKAALDLGGFGESGVSNTLVLLNGRRLNDVDLTGANLAALPLAAVERVEIMHGSGTVLYGDNAVGGVVNIITRDGADAGGQVELQAGSFGTRRLNASLGHGDGPTRLFVAAGALAADGYRDHAAVEERSLTADLSRDLGPGRLGLRALTAHEDQELPGALDQATFARDPAAAGMTTGRAEQSEQSWEVYYSAPDYSGELAYRSKRQDASVFGDTGADLATLSFTPRLRRALGKQMLVGGLDLYRSDLDGDADFGDAAARSAIRRDSYALYLTDTIELDSHWSVQAGGRSQQVEFTVASDDPIGGGHIEQQRDDRLNAWDLALNYRHADGGRSYLRRAASFRFPVVDEVWSYFSGAVTLLDPQTGRHWEAGTSQPLGGSARLEASLFRMDLDDEIGFDTFTYSNVNLDPTRHDGLQLRLTARPLAPLRLDAGYTWRRAEFRGGPLAGNEVPLVPQHKANLAAYWRSGVGELGASAVYTGERPFGNDYANVGERMDAYTRLDLSYRHEVGPWQVGATVKNATDVHSAFRGDYYGFAPYYYYPLPERAFYVSVGRRF